MKSAFSFPCLASLAASIPNPVGSAYCVLLLLGVIIIIIVWFCLSFSCVWLFATPWTVARQALLSMEFSRQNTGMVASPFSRRSSWPRDRTCVSFLAGGFFTIWAMREEAQVLLMSNSRIFLPIYLCFPTHFPSNSSSSVLLSFFKSTVWSCHFMSLSSHKKCSVTSHGLYPRLQPHRMALCPSGIHRTFSTQSLVSPSPLPEVPSTWGPLISLEPIPHHFAQS